MKQRVAHSLTSTAVSYMKKATEEVRLFLDGAESLELPLQETSNRTGDYRALPHLRSPLHPCLILGSYHFHFPRVHPMMPHSVSHFRIWKENSDLHEWNNGEIKIKSLSHFWTQEGNHD